MKKIISICLMVGGFIMAFSLSAQSVNDQGIGLRVGDPFGITYKSYFRNPMALEVVLGTTSANRHENYYKKAFDNANKYDGYNYVDHSIDYTIAVQARLLWHEKVPANVEGRFDYYYGLGGHMRVSNVDYSYMDTEGIIRTDSRGNFDLGPEGVLGLEYELLDYPIVAFSEVSLMTELVDNLRLRLFGAVGVRYAF